MYGSVEPPAWAELPSLAGLLGWLLAMVAVSDLEKSFEEGVRTRSGRPQGYLY